MPPVTQEEARKALADIDQVARQIRHAVAGSQMGTNLVIWGAVWIVGFALSALSRWDMGWIWWSLVALGMGLSALGGFRQHREGRIQSAQAHQLMRQLALFWLAVITYAMVLALRIPLRNGLDQLVLIVCLVMLAYVVMGIWLRSPLLAAIGLTVTVAALVGRSFLPPRAFLLWMAVFGGGGLFVPGLYVKLRWK